MSEQHEIIKHLSEAHDGLVAVIQSLTVSDTSVDTDHHLIELANNAAQFCKCAYEYAIEQGYNEEEE